jgi:hypothetical protein
MENFKMNYLALKGGVLHPRVPIKEITVFIRNNISNELTVNKF